MFLVLLLFSWEFNPAWGEHLSSLSLARVPLGGACLTNFASLQVTGKTGLKAKINNNNNNNNNHNHNHNHNHNDNKNKNKKQEQQQLLQRQQEQEQEQEQEQQQQHVMWRVFPLVYFCYKV